MSETTAPEFPAVPELEQIAPSADDKAILLHLKAWVRAEIAMAAAAVPLADRMAKNP
jgi:hypothetical protein